MIFTMSCNSYHQLVNCEHYPNKEFSVLKSIAWMYIDCFLCSFLPRAYAAGLSDWFCLSVRPSVHLSICCLSTQKSGYLAIYRVKRLLNTTVTLKSKKKMSGCVPDSRQSGSIRCIYISFLFNNGAFCHFNTVTTRIR